MDTQVDEQTNTLIDPSDRHTGRPTDRQANKQTDRPSDRQNIYSKVKAMQEKIILYLFLPLLYLVQNLSSLLSF